MIIRAWHVVVLVALVALIAYCRGPGAAGVVERAVDAAEANEMDDFRRWADPAALERSLAQQVLARYPGDPPEEELFVRAFRGRVERWVETPGPLLGRGAMADLFPGAALLPPIRVARDRVELPVSLTAGAPLVLVLQVERRHPLARRRIVGVGVRDDGWSIEPFAGRADEMIDRTARRLSEYERFLR